MLRVVIADDSPAVRRQLAALIASDTRFDVVGVAEDGEQAVELAARLRPDVMAVDIAMPRLDGFEATERIMALSPCPIVLVSAADVRDAEIGFRALRAGALEIVRKPEGLDHSNFESVRRTLLTTLELMAGVKVVRRHTPKPVELTAHNGVALIGVCASTGGPPALETILRELQGIRAPILIVQHIARGFAQNLVRWLNATSGVPVELATDGVKLAPGVAYVAPDDRHLTVRGWDIELADAPPVRHHRPSGDLLFSSMAHCHPGSSCAVILTGMGSDGTRGLVELRAGGGHVIAQDAATCVIPSMPRSAVEAGAVDEVLPLPAIAGRLRELAWVLR